MRDRCYLVTGASRGLGAVAATALAAGGARLVLAARDRDALERVRAGSCHPEHHVCVAADLRQTEQIAGLAVAAETHAHGTLDGILHVAGGGLGLREPLIAAADLETLFRVNVVAAAELNRRLVPGMVTRRSGCLVHVGSIAGSEAVASVGYNTVKAALSAYVRSLGQHLSGSGVVATGILPGAFRAPGNSWERLEAGKPDVVQKFIAERLPRGRLGEAAELVPLILFLCSPAASMMGGCMVPIDAGEGKSYAATG
ncbi:MAG: hypothetical protein A3K19_09940 [Lentisphaerae bacterium RIFOXYB12_FULL_65_16]|nr:MAG: hypothetical protein A3K18_00675 [Lentisphaerae bacterium RIFOXYA12_64_32]OGV91325.1 MAG: hypothetical protein A3K19_09940 [Lentisphaerae bacterium RIFOXYB12_FULL_65_16]